MYNTLAQLNEQFGTQNQINFELENGFIMMNIVNQYASAKISIYGGQVLSYLPHGQTEDLLYLSKKAIYQQGKAIRGGIPICWPWFADDTSGYGRPAHGFARNQQWKVLATMENTDGSTVVTLGLYDTDDSVAVWPYKFELKLDITVSEKLEIKLTTKNTGRKSFEITQALHAYLNVGNINNLTIANLNGISYVDKTDNFVHKTQVGDVVITAETDRVYQSSPEELIVDDLDINRKIVMESRGCNTAVIWNPWKNTAESMVDLQDEDYKVFIGVEAANADGDVIMIPAGGIHCLQASYSIR
ncbi:MAG: D-hexose-6-phosphate mutarotase [Piscirickettsiaceae bacterium]|nr:D-hexose-6-phosphate mutarotase [Piscirickettsiaceae bacterium]